MKLLRFNGKLLKYNNKLLRKSSGDAPVGHGWFIPTQNDANANNYISHIWMNFPDPPGIGELWLSNFFDASQYWTFDINMEKFEYKIWSSSQSVVLFRFIPKTGEYPGHTTSYNSVIVDTSGAEYDLEMYLDFVVLPMVDPTGFTGTLGNDGLENTLALYDHDPTPGTAVHYAVNFNPQ